jgi:hypothetical protein
MRVGFVGVRFRVIVRFAFVGGATRRLRLLVGAAPAAGTQTDATAAHANITGAAKRTAECGSRRKVTSNRGGIASGRRDGAMTPTWGSVPGRTKSYSPGHERQNPMQAANRGST